MFFQSFAQAPLIYVEASTLFLGTQKFSLQHRDRFFPTPQFWHFWHLHKAEFKDAGIRALPVGGKWVVDCSVFAHRASSIYFKPNDLRSHWELDADFQARLAEVSDG